MTRRIAFVLQPFDWVDPPNDNTSIQIWAYQVARRLADEHDVTVYVCTGGRPLRSRARRVDGIVYRHAPSLPDRSLDRVHSGLHRLWRSLPWTSGSRTPRFASVLHHLAYSLFVALDVRRRGFDTVHVFNFTQFISVIRKLNPTVTVGLHMHCEWVTQLDAAVVRRRLARTDVIIGCSDYITRGIRTAQPAMAGKCTTVRNGMAADRLLTPGAGLAPRRAEERRILFVGRLSPEKGIHVLVDAFRYISQAHPDVYLDIVGGHGSAPREFMVDLSSDPLITSLSRFYTDGYDAHLARQLRGDWSTRVSFVGMVANSDVHQFYDRADVFVFPSLYEAFGMPPVEAMAAAVPVVASRIGGLPETVQHGVNGLLVPPEDPRALADAVCELLEDGAKRERMGRAGRDWVRNRFSWDQITMDLQRAYGWERSPADATGLPVSGRVGR